jgi:hypothetical protein
MELAVLQRRHDLARMLFSVLQRGADIKLIESVRYSSTEIIEYGPCSLEDSRVNAALAGESAVM